MLHQPSESFLRRALTIVDAFALCSLVTLVFLWTTYPITLVRTVEILVAVYYFQVVCNDENGNSSRPNGNENCETVRGAPNVQDTVGCIVGWREDEKLFRESLDGLRNSPCLKSMIVGVDGDSSEDMDMLRIFRETFPDAPKPLYFRSTVGDAVLEANELSSSTEPIDVKVVMANVERIMIDQLGGSVSALHDVKTICVYQPHRCKKEILFTTLLVALVLARHQSAKYIWSSDSDSTVLSDTIDKAIGCLRARHRAGGISCRIKGWSPEPTMVSKMVAAKYWFDQDITRIQTAVSGASECQPGPCAAFRADALAGVLVKWHAQHIFGRRLITNEERHLTSTLLHRGWQVFYVPYAVVRTEAPNTAVGWVRQQLRWSRGTHFERFAAPSIYTSMHPWFTLHVAKELVLPFVACLAVCDYIFTGRNRFHLSTGDFALSVVVELCFTLATAAEWPSRDDCVYLLPSQLLYSLLKPAIHIWAFFTMLEMSWGADARVVDKSWRWLCYEFGFCGVWSHILLTFWTRVAVTTVNYYCRGYLPVLPLMVGVPFAALVVLGCVLRLRTQAM